MERHGPRSTWSGKGHCTWCDKPVPKGRRTFLARAEDWDGNLGPPIGLVTYRGALDDVAEFSLRTVDEAAATYANGKFAGATAGGTTLTSSAATGDWMFPDAVEPWMSADAESPTSSAASTFCPPFWIC